MKELNYLEKLLVLKEQQNLSKEDQERINLIKELFKNDNCFFSINMEAAVGILYFLGIPENEILDYYQKLISPENYKVPPKIRTIVSEDDVNSIPSIKKN